LSLATPFNILGEPLIELPLVESTNIYAMEQIRSGQAISGSAFTTDFQTRGKGQMHKFWESENGKNILISYTLEWGNSSFTNGFGLSVAVSLGLFDFYSQIAGEETSIKWPNDLYWRDRKAVGILIENSLRGTQITWSVIGLGINVNQTVFNDAPNPVSLKQITGKNWDRKALINQLSAHLKTQINLWLSGEAETQLTRYNQHLYQKNQVQKFKSGSRLFEAVVKEVNQEGQLILEAGMEEAFNFGSLEWIK
jgi:BirA family biotin operon repressor/biotin-[acetyl-CoA-carboxylase] ligase